MVLIGAAGQSLLVPIEVLALQNKELQAYNQTLAVSNKEDLAKGVIAIDGYEYVGYLVCGRSIAFARPCGMWNFAPN